MNTCRAKDNKSLNETAMVLNGFKSLYEIQSGYNIYCEYNQLFPCNISYKNLNCFYLQKYKWNKIFFEFLFVGSCFFNNISPQTNHIWNILIPNKLNLNKICINKLIGYMKPIIIYG